MKNILVFLAFLLVISCQQYIVLDSYTGYWNKGPKAIVKTYSGKSNHLDVSISGWFMFDPTIRAGGWNLFLTVQSEKDFNRKAYPGESIFGLQYTQNMIDLHTWSIPPINKQNRYPVPQGDFGKWVFMYFGYGGAQRRVFTHLAFPSGLKTYTIENVSHMNIDTYVVSAGSYHNVLYFPGTIQKLAITFGPKAYTETNFDGFKQFNPDGPKNCVIIYTECYYAGEAQSLCEKRPIDASKIKSILIPKGYSVKIANPVNPAQVNIYTQSVECIEQLTWKFFDQKTVEVTKKGEASKKIVLRRN